ncbi:hypothetical protein [Pseudonocardia sp. TRM90224]|uniref:hypothetical protein n=1 Tax=Pseudonocardia sp. TRM90224 TaxID=2812678 RepID=UPI001E5E8A77|nr:hypothetical protein [Pseudonocardia sp. TRM90224]
MSMFRISSALVAAAAAVLLTASCSGLPGSTAAQQRTAPTPTPTAAAEKDAPTEEAETARTTPAGGTQKLVLEALGTGQAYSLAWAADTSDFITYVDLPWKREFVVPDTLPQQFQVVVVGGENVGCRITLDDEVVVEQSDGNGHCVYERN